MNVWKHRNGRVPGKRARLNGKYLADFSSRPGLFRFLESFEWHKRFSQDVSSQMVPPTLFFQNQVVFLTGSTGHLGACLLFKLVLVVPVAKIYVLIRGSKEQAIASWTALMEPYVHSILATKKVHYVTGDMTGPNLGICASELVDIANAVTIIINAAANISLKASLRDSAIDNCLPALELGRLASSFSSLISFVQVSSLYALSFLSDGLVEEKLYTMKDPEDSLGRILAGRDADSENYAWPYARAKHLMECLLATRHLGLPLMILRPSSIGPALFQPFEMYGKPSSMPINSFLSRLMYPSTTPNLFHAAASSTSGTNILDEIPVDLVANILLQHVQKRTCGVVHASSQFYIPRSFDDFVADVFKWVPDCWKEKIPPVTFTVDNTATTGSIARFYQMSTRNWTFLSSCSCVDKEGPLAVTLDGHDQEKYARKRVEKVYEATRHMLNMLGQGSKTKI